MNNRLPLSIRLRAELVEVMVEGRIKAMQREREARAQCLRRNPQNGLSNFKYVEFFPPVHSPLVEQPSKVKRFVERRILRRGETW